MRILEKGKEGDWIGQASVGAGKVACILIELTGKINILKIKAVVMTQCQTN